VSDVEKLDHLKNSLSGEPLRIIAHLQSVDTNYPLALELLRRRYENKRVLVSKHLEALFTCAPAKTEAAQHLRRILDTFTSNRAALTNLGMSTTDYIMVYLLISKLDPETRKWWEMTIPSASSMPTYTDLEDFLDKRTRGLESCAQRFHTETKQEVKPTPKAKEVTPQRGTYGYSTTATEETAAAAVSQTGGPTSRPGGAGRGSGPGAQPAPVAESYNCVHCDKPGHKIYQCEIFKKLAVMPRRQFVKAAGLCFSCMGTGHVLRACRSKFRCKECQSNIHHTMLHVDPVPNNSRANYTQLQQEYNLQVALPPTQESDHADDSSVNHS
jgi:hypothetical protein